MRAVITCVLVLGAMGCTRGMVAPAATPEVRPPPTAEEKASFAKALGTMARHERASDWDDDACKETVALLLAGAPSAIAEYDAGLVEQRCHHDAQARAHFETAALRDPQLHAARAALALSRAGAPGKLDAAIVELASIVHETRFGDADALVSLATLEARRGNAMADEDGSDDLDRARRNLQRALAIDDASMPAMNQLALVQLERARRAAGSKADRKRAGAQALELAVLVCQQAITKNPRFAPIHNTLGLVEVELGNLSRAAASFDEARRLDPRLVEAQMNVGALNLEVRGYARAEDAYRAVLAIRPDDYDARIGLALAISGQIDAADGDARVAAASDELQKAKRLAPDRPEAYFNDAILVQEYGGRGGSQGDTLASLARAKGLYEQFLAKADGAPAYASARDRARERLKDLEQIAQVAGSAPPVP